MFDTGDAVIPLATAIQWVLATVTAAGGVVGYVWSWTLRREARMQDRLDAIRQVAQDREQAHSDAVKDLINQRLEDHEKWRATLDSVCTHP